MPRLTEKPPVLEKTCKDCLETLPLSAFSPARRGIYGVDSKCRKCIARIAREKRAADPVAAIARLRDYRKANPEKVRQWRASARERNPEACRARFRNWREKNRERCIARVLEWKAKNPDAVKRARQKRSERLKHDPMYAIKHRIYSRLRNGLCGNSEGRIDEVGCCAGELKRHIELLFPDGMGWHNMSEWAIDHFYPIAAIGRDPDWLSLAAVCNYRNLRPVWKRANAVKRDIIVQDAVALFETIKELIMAGKA